MKPRVLVGMSGGVDSSAAALVLLNAGYDVSGITMLLHSDLHDEVCGSEQGAQDAADVCRQLHIPHRVVDFSKTFSECVRQNFVSEYISGRTPNPCIRCNRHLKFGAMLDYALKDGFDYIATGHYAVLEEQNGRQILRRSPSDKDQSYVLYQLSQYQLAHTLFPLGRMEKPEIRLLAQDAGLSVAHKAESQDICFIPDGDYNGFLARTLGKEPEPGNFVDVQGNVLGRHRGITRYTIGQRKGLGLSFGRPMYVIKIDPAANQVVLGPEGSQYASGLLAGKMNWIAFDQPACSFDAKVKVRYRANPADARIIPLEDGRVRVEFKEPQRSVTPGQAAVFYQENLVLGGGTIFSALP